MVEVQSNNPYRRSMSGSEQQQFQLSSYTTTTTTPTPSDLNPNSPSPSPPIPHSHSPSPPPLAKFPSSTTTIAEEPENETDAPRIVVKAATVCEDNKECVITIHPTGSTSSVPQHKEYPAQPIRTNTHPHPRQSMGEPCSVWPARRFMQKQVMQKKTKWIIIKVLCALIFVVGAVAIGFGISEAAGRK